ncbi:MAG: hypothetical protein A2X81_17895 [Desulfobacterales bacterium GWB2_56_26]|nr:MAG: hypothetical protein A2X81_17895 [Desulfobacterales bacterium GWB2_56_26]
MLSLWCDSSGGQACDVKDFDDPAGAVLRDVRILPFSGGESPDAVFQSACGLGGASGFSAIYPSCITESVFGKGQLK